MKKSLLHKYFSTETTPEEEKQVLDWVEHSTDNYTEYLKERKLWNSFLVNSHNETFDVGKNKGKTTRLWKIATVAASIALLVSLSGLFITLSDTNKGMHSVIVPAGQRTQLLLEDGTEVWLNARTTITYPAAFDKDSRKVTLNGEGYFTVNPDKDRPFIIQTENYNVHVLGTTINVFAYDNSSNPFELSLLTGKVRLEDHDGNEQDITLAPNEYAVERNGSLHKDKIISMDRFRWKDGLICLDDEPFDTLMKKFSEYYDIKIIVKNDTYSKYRCTGKFRTSDGIDYALRVLQRDVKFKYKRDEERHTITIE